ncbi:hypothetical protein VST7929_02854 [Vibrio stylophorae]|uniref:Uncharacterized protein n=1 Tax=Vibrio stylophorae TaxID=659351 RepID=A0ABN8DXT8_9VIBR|nr:hypothetical protein [Vibrio stylophorae]CAH0535193.1 hypothetical protein VST7929_02854 [Vibrio stylophorae]
MAANAAIYLPVDQIDPTHVFDKVTLIPAENAQTAHSYQIDLSKVGSGQTIIQLNVMEKSVMTPHLTSFVNYVAGLDEPEERRLTAAKVIGQTRMVVGLVTAQDFQDDPEIWHALFRLAGHYRGFVFVHDSLVMANGMPLVGPLVEKMAQ